MREIKMKGRVYKFFNDKGYGFITSEDGESYFFHISQLVDASTINAGYLVEFDVSNTPKGKQAQQIRIVQTMSSNKRFITIGNERIKLSNIKNYGKSYEYAIYEISTEGQGIKSVNDSFFSDMEDIFYFWTNPFYFDEGKKYYKFLQWSSSPMKYIDRYYYGDNYRVEVECRKVPYVWLTTYQNENYKFHDERKTGLKNIKTAIDDYDTEKILHDLDMYLN